MLQVPVKPVVAQSSEVHESTSVESLRRILAIARRQLSVIVAIFIVIFALTLVYLATTPSRFTATASMVIDTTKMNLFQQQTIMNDAVVDSTAVETQAQVLRSDNVALSVIQELHLTNDPEFVGSGGGLLPLIARSIYGLFTASSAPSQNELTQTALGTFRKLENIRRDGLTYVISISFTSLSPERAAQIANAIADAYVVDQMDARYQATKRAGVWLQSRIAELRDQTRSADKAVQDFKEKNNIIDADGRLMSEQQLAEVNSQLILTRAQTAEAKARLDRIQEILRDNGAIPDAGVAEVLRSDVITKLRSEYLSLADRELLWAAKYGSDHLAVVNLRNQMDEIRKSIFDELKRIGGTYRSDYEIALAREQSIEASLGKVVAQSQTSKQAEIQLRELQSNSQTYRTLYDNFLRRYMEAIQQQSFPISEARVISAAAPPLHRSQPSITIALAMAFLASTMLGAGAAMAREASDRVFRTTSQVDQYLHAPCIALLPNIVDKRGEAVSGKRGVGDREIRRGGLLAYAIENPLTRFAEFLRSIKISLDVAVGLHGAKTDTGVVLAFTSTLPHEGKSTVAANFARLMAHARNRVLLIDADLRYPQLSIELAPNAQLGLLEVLNRHCAVEDAICTDRLSGMDFLPVASASRKQTVHTNEVLAARSMKELIEDLQSRYGIIVVDLPPLAPIVDVRATANFVDYYAFVIEWGKTRIDVASHHLSGAQNVHERLLGIILNKANVKRLNCYENYYGAKHYREHYSRYGYSV